MSLLFLTFSNCTYVQCTSLELELKKIPENSKSAYLGSFQLNPIPMNKHKIKLNSLVEQRWNGYFLRAFISAITTTVHV